MKRLLTLLALAAAALPASRVAAEDKVDRERLKKVLPLPVVRPQGWYYSISSDGRVWEPGQEPHAADVGTLRGRIADEKSDAQGWLDLGAAYGRDGNAAQRAECVGRAVEILRLRAQGSADDGEALAAFGLALAAAGDDASADEAVRRAQKAPRAGWAGAAASAELLVVRTMSKAAKKRFGSRDEAGHWIEEDPARAANLDAATLDSATKLLDEAVAAIRKDGVVGPRAASVHLLRRWTLTLRDACAPPAEAAVDRRRRTEHAADDYRSALEVLAPEPFALTLLALDDAMSAPPERRVRKFEDLEPAVRATFGEKVAKLRSIATSADAATGARALQGLACLQWFVLGNGEATEARLREAMSRDPRAHGASTALAFVLHSLGRWDDLAQLYADWIGRFGSADERALAALYGMAGSALAAGGRFADSEKQMRAAVALDPKSVTARLGVIALALRRAKTAADLDEVRKLLVAATAALPKSEDPSYPSLDVGCGIANAVVLGLDGKLDECEKVARGLLDRYGEFPHAHEVLAAIGR